MFVQPGPCVAHTTQLQHWNWRGGLRGAGATLDVKHQNIFPDSWLFIPAIDRRRGKYSLTEDCVACGRGLLKALRTAMAICWRVYPATLRRSPPAAPKVSVKIRENVTKKTDFNISTFHQRPRNQPKAEGSGHTHTKSRWFIKNYQTIIKQLSNNYQTTIKQLSNN